jgi:nanoRNase/pAp phosphatase (c-di-AMP/oligoRNAs hydrolase)
MRGLRMTSERKTTAVSFANENQESVVEPGQIKTEETAKQGMIKIVAGFLSELGETEEKERSDKVSIIVHNTPDPDAIGSARALQWILNKKYAISSSVFYGGDVSHPQNRTMVNILDIRLQKIEELNDDYNVQICLDCTEHNSPAELPNLVIDHHRVSSEAKISWIEPVGATATLIWELIKFLNIPIDEEIDQDVATALFLGIRVDTQDMISENTTDRDFEAFKELANFVNRKKLANIIDYPLPSYFFEAEREINREDQDGNFINQESKGSCFVGCIGITTAAKRDAIPMLADKVVRMEGIETAVVFGVVGDSMVASIRSENTSLDVNTFAKAVFGKQYSGGKMGFAGATVPLGIFGVSDVPTEIRDQIWNALKNVIFHKVFHVVAGN